MGGTIALDNPIAYSISWWLNQQENMMKLQQDKYSLLVSDGELIIQRADYIEDGWYVAALDSGGFEVREIVQYGGGERLVSNHETLLSAIKAGESIT